MCGRSRILLVALWTLVLAPAFCIAGLIHHDCGCHEQTCSHEADCETDPCLQLSHATHSWRPAQLAAAGLDGLPAGPDAVPTLTIHRSLELPREFAAPPPVIHDSDFPLLL